MEIKNIPFEDGELLGVRTPEGNIYLGVKKACIDIGLSDGQARRQVENIQEDLVLSKGITNLRLLTKGGEQLVLGIHEEFVPLWLAKIALTPKMKKENPQAVDKLIKYQLKAQKVLHEAFSLETITEEMGLKGQIVQLEEKVDTLTNKVNELIDNSTINSRQAQKILFAGKDRVSEILGGAHSEPYKQYSRMYFKNMWNSFAETFKISTYKDLSPLDINNAYTFLKHWSMV